MSITEDVFDKVLMETAAQIADLTNGNLALALICFAAMKVLKANLFNTEEKEIE